MVEGTNCYSLNVMKRRTQVDAGGLSEEYCVIGGIPSLYIKEWQILKGADNGV
jgi:hypothetical protein